MSNHCLINGIATDYISVDDRGLHYGDGLFETMRYTNGKCQFWDQHIARMSAGADALNIHFPGEQCFKADVNALVEKANATDLVIKLILTRGSGERGYAVKKKSLPLRVTIITNHKVTPELHKGIKATVCKQTVSINKGLAGLKHLNRLENVIARNEWHDEFHEGIMLDDDGNIIEGTMSNLFVVKDNQLQTPDLTRSGVSGVMRDAITTLANTIGINVNVKTISLGDLHEADELFVTNSLIGIWPIVALDSIEYKLGNISQQLQAALQPYCDDNAKILK